MNKYNYIHLTAQRRQILDDLNEIDRLLILHVSVFFIR